MIIRKFKYNNKWTLKVLLPYFFNQASLFGLHYLTEYILIIIQKSYKINNEADFDLYKKATSQLMSLCINSSALHWSKSRYIQEIVNIIDPLVVPSNLNFYVVSMLELLLYNIELSNLIFLPKFNIEKRHIGLKQMSYHEQVYLDKLVKIEQLKYKQERNK